MNPSETLNCPLAKVRLPSSDVVAGIVSRAFEAGHLYDGSRASSHVAGAASVFQRLASDDLLVDKEVCGFHLSRALIGLLVELNTGAAGEDFYPAFSAALHRVVAELTAGSPDVEELAHDCLNGFLGPCAFGGVSAFAGASNSMTQHLIGRPRPQREGSSLLQRLRGLFG